MRYILYTGCILNSCLKEAIPWVILGPKALTNQEFEITTFQDRWR